MYTSDLPAYACQSAEDYVSCNLFADGTVLISAHDTASEACHAFQPAVTRTDEWLTASSLLVNPTKSSCFLFNRSLSNSKTTFGQVSIGNTRLPITGTQKHLGLNFTGNLQWGTHLSTVISKTRRLLSGLLKRLKESRLNKQALSSIYKLYIRPQLKYASTAWSNLTQQQSDTLERSQRKVAKIIPGYRLSDHLNHTYLLPVCCRVGHTFVEASTATCTTRIQALRRYSSAPSPRRRSSTTHQTKTIAPLKGLCHPIFQHWSTSQVTHSPSMPRFHFLASQHPKCHVIPAVYESWLATLPSHPMLLLCTHPSESFPFY